MNLAQNILYYGFDQDGLLETIHCQVAQCSGCIDTPLPQHATKLLALFLSALPRSHHLVTFSTHSLDKAHAAAAMILVRQQSL